ncbi:amino acid ABC transporter permease [Bifidobacterium sp.]|jgi:His/Glu/Gln/Arg/opine family amino acid ABC transporter permease subunit|uniref:amino acid ABC transporter permease n=1 Tax=Bifidobacterium sp. TaxID=41200 RepID=UPI0025BA085C|nr:amino acid ABC transporter permease [Bifidobacterium sp.]MCH4160039.1 amino acid ABC transporter permease [Bifidobacterium sp.]MCH4174824.1 amino acid ABC transporter permease [Bifidobacterium sp.]MCI1635008.1 amino acid ABC transporter permease [Bifidobacterium sp.]
MGADLSHLLNAYGTQFLSSYWVSLRIALLAFAGGFLLGTLLTVARVSPIPPLRGAVNVYVETFRNAPVLCVLIFIVYALPDLGVVIDYEPSVIIALILVSSAFACDNLRTGINTIDAGQIEAARALGMGFGPIVSSIVLPQAFRSVIQPMVTLFISVVISSSAGSLVPLAHKELTGLVAEINNHEALGILTFLIASLLYVCTGLVIAFFGRKVERRLAIWR